MIEQAEMHPAVAYVATEVRKNLQCCLDAHPELYGVGINICVDNIGLRNIGRIHLVTCDEDGNALDDVPDRSSIFVTSTHNDRAGLREEATVYGTMLKLVLPPKFLNMSACFTLYRSGLYRVQSLQPTSAKTNLPSLLTITVPKRFRDRLAKLTGELPPLPPTPEPVAPPVATAARTDVRPENDLETIEKLLRTSPATGGFRKDEIRAAEKQRGVQFPEELRLFFSLVSEGTVLNTAADLDEDDYDALFYDDDAEDPWYAEVHNEGLFAGTGELGNVVDPVARRLGDVGEIRLPEPTDDDVVQPALASPLWIVFADDGGGNAYAMDLAPGPQGCIGQIIQFNHETFDPPVRVAESLTAFLQGDCTYPTDAMQLGRLNPSYVIVDTDGDSPNVRICRKIPTDLTHCLERIGLEKLQPGTDLAELRAFPKLKEMLFLSAFHPESTDLSALRSLTQVTTLSIAPDLVDHLIAEDAFPPNMTKLTIDESCDQADIRHFEAVNRMRQHMGLKPHPIHTWETTGSTKF